VAGVFFPITGLGSIQQPCWEDAHPRAQCYAGMGQLLPKPCLEVITEKADNVGKPPAQGKMK